SYAGAYVYGRRRRTPIGRRSGSRQGATEAVAIQDWPVCLKDAFPGYIDWEEFMANQRRLADNLNHYDANRHGVPRQGNALLQGIAICGRCSRRMGLHYSGRNGNYPVYLCRADQHQHGGARCQEVRALGVDAAVERLLLEALTPDRLAVAMAALGELENEARALERQWALKRERARYEAERARRQYDAVEPENRLVARSLERVSERTIRRNVNSYRNYADVATLEARVRELVDARKIDREIARALNAEGLLSAHGRPFSGDEVHLLRKRWNIPTVKINRTEHN